RVLTEVPRVPRVGVDEVIRVATEQQPHAPPDRGRVGRLDHQHAVGGEELVQPRQHLRRRGVQVLEHLVEHDEVVGADVGRRYRVIEVVEVELDVTAAARAGSVGGDAVGGVGGA